MPKDPSSTTLAVYDKGAKDYLEKFQALETPLLSEFIAAMPVGGSVLDLGCGPGHLAGQMAQAGLQVTATDGSAEMVALADALPGVTARQMLFDQIAGVHLYDGIWANFSLLHAPKAKLPDHLNALHRTCKPGALLHLGMKLGDGEGTDRLGRFYSYYSQDELTELLQKAGFHAFRSHLGEGPGLAGNTEPWVLLWARAEKETP